MAQQNHFYKNSQLHLVSPLPSPHLNQTQDQINRALSSKDDPMVLDILLSHHIARLTTQGYDNIQLVEENIRLQSGIMAEIDRIQRCWKSSSSQKPQNEGSTCSQGKKELQQLQVALKYLSTGFDRYCTILKQKSKIIICLAKILKVRNLEIEYLKKQLDKSQVSQAHLRNSLESLQRQIFQQSSQKQAEDSTTGTSEKPILKHNETQTSLGASVKTGKNQLASYKLESIRINPSSLTSYFIINNQLNIKIQIEKPLKTDNFTQTLQTRTDSAAAQTQSIIQPLKSIGNNSLSIQTEHHIPQLCLNQGDSISILCERKKGKQLSLSAVFNWQWQGHCTAQIDTAMTEEDQTFSKFSYVAQQSNEDLLSYIKEISHYGSDVDYNEEAIRNLQKMGKQNQVSKAFARLLKENKCLRICLNKLIDNESQQEERNNSRIKQLLQQPSPSKLRVNQQNECQIY